MRVLVAGGSGFLGRALSARLRDDGAGVGWLSRTPQRYRTQGIDAHAYDSLAADDAFDVVVNLTGAGIAERRWSPARKRELLDSRLGPTQKLIDWMRGCRQRPKVFLSGSAAGWYGNQRDLPLTEDSPFHDEFTHELCARWEACAQQAEALEVPTVLLRSGVVLHPEGGMLKRLLTPFRLGLGGRLGDGRQYLSWITRDDWVEAARFLIHAHLHGSSAQVLRGPVNLCSPNPVTNAEFTAALAHALHRPAALPVPGFALKLALGEMSTLLLDGQRVLPARLTDAGHVFRHPQLAAALRDQLGQA